MSNKCTGFKVSGVLQLDQEDLSNIDYQVLDERGQLNNLSLGLFTYLNKNIRLRLVVRELELEKEGVLLHREMNNGIKQFVILHNGIFVNLDRVLWNNVGEFIKIELELIEDSNGGSKVTVK